MVVQPRECGGCATSEEENARPCLGPRLRDTGLDNEDI